LPRSDPQIRATAKQHKQPFVVSLRIHANESFISWLNHLPISAKLSVVILAPSAAGGLTMTIFGGNAAASYRYTAVSHDAVVAVTGRRPMTLPDLVRSLGRPAEEIQVALFPLVGSGRVRRVVHGRRTFYEAALY